MFALGISKLGHIRDGNKSIPTALYRFQSDAAIFVDLIQ